MVVARLSTWKFKPGQRDAALEVISKKGDEAGETKGFRGYLFLMPSDDPDAAVLTTLWEDEESLQASSEGIFREVSGEVERYTASPPEVKKLHVHSAEIAEIVPELAKPA
ncbi:MAG: Antibiotic biosynthesis monooxygenase [Methanoculleus sp.]|nr:Antibiotic biosynthesis monooxygenase [Methanoculleus sp.]